MMVKYIHDTNQITVDSTIRVLSDSIAVTSSFDFPDTLKVVDVGNYFGHPAFLVSLVAIMIALFAIFKPLLDQRKTRRKLKEYTLFFAQQLINTFDKKIIQVKKLAIKIKDIDSIDYIYNVSLTYRASNLLSIPQNELFEIFVSKKEPNHTTDYKYFKNLFDAISYFITHDRQAEKNYVQFHSDSRRHEDYFSNNLKAITQQYDRFRLEAAVTNTKPSQDPFLKEFDVILSDWIKLDNYNNHSITKSELLDPLKEVTKKYTKDPRALIVRERIVDCNNADSQLRNVNKIYSKEFNRLADALEKQRNILTDAIKYFRST